MMSNRPGRSGESSRPLDILEAIRYIVKGIINLEVWRTLCLAYHSALHFRFFCSVVGNFSSLDPFLKLTKTILILEY